MTHEEFIKLIEKEFENIKEVLSTKKDGYNQLANDRFDQFKRIGKFRYKQPMEVLAGMMAKHTDSIYYMITLSTHSQGGIPIEVWREKITDHIAYLFLLWGLVSEEEK